MLMVIIVCMEKDSSKHSVNDICILHENAQNISTIKDGKLSIAQEIQKLILLTQSGSIYH